MREHRLFDVPERKNLVARVREELGDADLLSAALDLVATHEENVGRYGEAYRTDLRRMELIARMTDVKEIGDAYSVAARVREIGVRVALGAARGTVVWMIVRDGLAIAVPGVLIGAPCAWAAARLVRARLYGVAPGDPRTLLIAAAIFLATVLAASLLPALRASRVAPVEALREE